MTQTTKVRAPFVRPHRKDIRIMSDVLAAAIPPLVWSLYCFGARAGVIVAVSVVFAFFSEWLYDRYVLKKNTADISPLITGVLIGFSLPVSVPLWLPAFASVFAIVISKKILGRIGKNIFNPAVSGICVSYLLFGKYMTVFTKPFAYLPAFSVSVDKGLLDSLRVVTPLENLKLGKVNISAISDCFYGISPGIIGGVSSALLVLSLVYLLFRRKITLTTTVSYLLTIISLTYFTAYADSEPVDFMMTQLFSGAIMLTCVFFINDYATTPTYMMGKVIFSVVCGGLTVLFRYHLMTYYAEFFALAVSNALVPLINKYTRPVVYGGKILKEQKSKADTDRI